MDIFVNFIDYIGAYLQKKSGDINYVINPDEKKSVLKDNKLLIYNYTSKIELRNTEINSLKIELKNLEDELDNLNIKKDLDLDLSEREFASKD